jgi:chemotaxis protein methyltransferase CheR
MFEEEDIRILIKAFKDCGGYDFGNYSLKSFTRRVEKVLYDNKMDIYALTNAIKIDSDFLEKTVRDITVNTTEIFRDPSAWQVLKYRVLPRLHAKKEINVWHAGCSTGLEVYSMEILLYEAGLLDKANIYATDINTEVLKTARGGVYSYRSASEYLGNYQKALCVNPYNMDEKITVPIEKYIEINHREDTVKIKPFLLGKAVFKKHNLVSEGNPFDVRYDMILCRNVLIYFDQSLQNRLFMDFWKYLEGDGVLMLGIHESILGPVSAKYDKKGLVYQKRLL